MTTIAKKKKKYTWHQAFNKISKKLLYLECQTKHPQRYSEEEICLKQNKMITWQKLWRWDYNRIINKLKTLVVENSINRSKKVEVKRNDIIWWIVNLHKKRNSPWEVYNKNSSSANRHSALQCNCFVAVVKILVNNCLRRSYLIQL